MKLFILTCLVAVALARPKPSESSEPTPLELREEYINGMNRNRIMAEPEQSESSTSSSSEQALHAQKYIPRERAFYQPCLERACRMSENSRVQVQALHAQQKYIPRESVFYQPYLEQTHRMSENNHVQLEHSQLYLELNQPAAYPYAVWYYPQIRQNLPFPPFSDIFSPIAPENYEKN
uniref:alpha-S1-casein isoform X2 n=1 Tax=Callithrix jacchus TaxID=9483 RepID=UPI00159F6616|nr:alpha-S1-casein isoform X2 [Callithrix jacchus]